tara:strand:- start:550 stop:708 length:159 start_codon:yes stop_codon:yes gene_type:complete
MSFIGILDKHSLSTDFLGLKFNTLGKIRDIDSEKHMKKTKIIRIIPNINNLL